MKILFLDIDGVLNSNESRAIAHMKRPGDWGTHRGWIPAAVEQLKRIIQETSCQIVISSDWRLRGNIGDLRTGFEAFGLPNWLGVTPELGMNSDTNGNRGFEIATWIEGVENNGDVVESHAIVDDNPWMLPHQANVFVRTSESTGMTKSDADRIIGILNNVPQAKSDGN